MPGMKRERVVEITFGGDRNSRRSESVVAETLSMLRGLVPMGGEESEGEENSEAGSNEVGRTDDEDSELENYDSPDEGSDEDRGNRSNEEENSTREDISEDDSDDVERDDSDGGEHSDKEEPDSDEGENSDSDRRRTSPVPPKSKITKGKRGKNPKRDGLSKALRRIVKICNESGDQSAALRDGEDLEDDTSSYNNALSSFVVIEPGSEQDLSKIIQCLAKHDVPFTMKGNTRQTASGISPAAPIQISMARFSNTAELVPGTGRLAWKGEPTRDDLVDGVANPTPFQKQLIDFVVTLVMFLVTYTKSYDILDEVLGSLGGIEGFANKV